MEKEVKKKVATAKKNVTKKANAVKKDATKKVNTAKKKVAKKVNEQKKETLNKLNVAQTKAKNVINEVIEESFNKEECPHCHKYYDKGLTICPHCRKSIKDRTGTIVIAILAVVLLLCIIFSYFVDKFVTNPVSIEEYKANCELLSYEDLVRHASSYKNKPISVIGKVVSVEGTDLDYGNEMVITINANLFNENDSQIIKIEFTDKDYSQGFITGDLITVYGKYNSINGNTPLIKAEYIIFGN